MPPFCSYGHRRNKLCGGLSTTTPGGIAEQGATMLPDRTITAATKLRQPDLQGQGVPRGRARGVVADDGGASPVEMGWDHLPSYKKALHEADPTAVLKYNTREELGSSAPKLDDTMAGKLAERDEIVDAVQMAGSALSVLRTMLDQNEPVSLRLSSDYRHHVETTARFKGSVTVTFTLPDGSETELAASASIEQENDRHGQWVLGAVRDAVPALDSSTVIFRCDFRFQKLLRRAFPAAKWVAST